MGFFDKMLKAPILKVCMFGPRGVGKTSVMTSIFKDSQSGFSGSQIYMQSGDDKSSELLEFSGLLEQAIETGNAGNLPASNKPADYLFNLGVLGKKATVQLQIKDFPGEYIAEYAKPEERRMVLDYVSESTIVLVAVDSPYVMELDGKHNHEKNRPDLVTAFFRKNPEAFRNKLVLFVPLKCERYFYDGRMAELAQKVKETYKDLMPYFIENNIASAIVPILTLGGIEFDQMEQRAAGAGVSAVSRFRLYAKNPKYNPLFCAQPIYYLLTYVAAHYEWQKQNSGVFDRMKDMLFSYITKDETFKKEIFKMRNHIVLDKLGFELLTSNSIFKL